MNTSKFSIRKEVVGATGLKILTLIKKVNLSLHEIDFLFYILDGSCPRELFRVKKKVNKRGK